jgi:hypothetical protein
MATSGEKKWPPMGRNRWPLTPDLLRVPPEMLLANVLRSFHERLAQPARSYGSDAFNGMNHRAPQLHRRELDEIAETAGLGEKLSLGETKSTHAHRSRVKREDRTYATVRETQHAVAPKPQSGQAPRSGLTVPRERSQN